MESQFVGMYPEKRLVKEMGEYTRELTENDRTIFKKGESDDYVDSFMLCNLAITNFTHNGAKRIKPFKSFGLGTNVFRDKTYQKKRKRNRYTKRR